MDIKKLSFEKAAFALSLCLLAGLGSTARDARPIGTPIVYCNL
jgi:hypothetical protein